MGSLVLSLPGGTPLWPPPTEIFSWGSAGRPPWPTPVLSGSPRTAGHHWSHRGPRPLSLVPRRWHLHWHSDCRRSVVAQLTISWPRLWPPPQPAQMRSFLALRHTNFPGVSPCGPPHCLSRGRHRPPGLPHLWHRGLDSEIREQQGGEDPVNASTPG